MSDRGDCIFCGIAGGEMPAHVVHEGDDVVAFLDANPLARGHTLVIPREHHGRLGDLPAELAASLFGAVHELTPAVEAAVDADGITLGVNDGAAAGQEVPHVHCHVVPRFEGDGGGPIHAAFASRPDLSDDELAGIAGAIRGDGG